MLIIKKSKEFKNAFTVAKNLSDYFNSAGLKQIKKDLTKQILFGAYLNKEMVGFITYKKLNPKAIEITWLAVKKEFQSQGIGGRLVRESIKRLKNKYKICEVKTLAETHPDSGYEKTRSFYKKLGFIALEIIDPYPGWDDKNPAQIFVKSLE